MKVQSLRLSRLNLSHWMGPFLIAVSSLLWATDSVVRYPAIQAIDPILLVLVEHVLAVLILLPWILLKHGRGMFVFNGRQWLAAIFSGMAGSALATVLFTASFYYVNPSVSVLLQKLQPFLVILIASIFLGEKPTRKVIAWGAVALAAGVALSFPDLNFSFLKNGFSLESRGVQYALAAALIWAASTVSGKVLLERVSAPLATFWRFFFGLIGLALLMGLSGDTIHWSQLASQLTSTPSLAVLLYLSLIPGLFAMLIYYQGLARTRASVSTFVELLYPVGAVALNTIFLHTPLGLVQTVAAGILMLAVAMISL